MKLTFNKKVIAVTLGTAAILVGGYGVTHLVSASAGATSATTETHLKQEKNNKKETDKTTTKDCTCSDKQENGEDKPRGERPPMSDDMQDDENRPQKPERHFDRMMPEDQDGQEGMSEEDRPQEQGGCGLGNEQQGADKKQDKARPEHDKNERGPKGFKGKAPQDAPKEETETESTK